jgi:hypothetical protein
LYAAFLFPTYGCPRRGISASDNHTNGATHQSAGAAAAAALGRPIPPSSSSAAATGGTSPTRSFSPRNGTPSTPESFVRQPSAQQLLR